MIESIKIRSIFSNFLRTDMMVEMIREIKTMLVLELAENYQDREELHDWINDHILLDDEKTIYNVIMEKFVSDIWKSSDDIEYLEETLLSWDQQFEAALNFLQIRPQVK